MAALSSSGGTGSRLDSTESEDGLKDQVKDFDDMRRKQLKVLQVLKARKVPASAKSGRSQSGVPGSRLGKRLSRQATYESNDSYDVLPRSGSVPSRRVSFEGNPQEERTSLLEDAWETFTEDMRELHTLVTIQRGRIDGLSKSSQDAPAQTAELLQAAEARAPEQLGLPETETLLKAAKGSVETFNVMDKKRSQDVQLAIEGLWDALRTQGRQIQGVRGLAGGIAALEKAIEAQAGQIGELQHAVQEIYNCLYWAWEVMEAQEAVFDDVAAQLREHHREEIQRIEFGLAIRERATDTLQVELESLRRREVEPSAAHLADRREGGSNDDGCRSRGRSHDSRSSTTTISVQGWGTSPGLQPGFSHSRGSSIGSGHGAL